MPVRVTEGALLSCSMGSAPGTLVVAGSRTGGQKPTVAVDNTKVPSFGLCSSLGNPETAAATAAAFGVLSARACTPTPSGPWTGATGSKVVDSSCKLTCLWGGVISVLSPQGSG